MGDKNKNKGLADNQDGEFILNESGTSVTVDVDVPEEDASEAAEPAGNEGNPEEGE